MTSARAFPRSGVPQSNYRTVVVLRSDPTVIPR